MGISGSDLTQRAVVQAEKFGATLSVPCIAASLGNKAGHLVVRLSDGSDVAGRAVIAATGAAYRRLEASRLREFEDNGVYYAATEMESRICGTAPVVVVGGGSSAGQASIFLSQSGCPVTLTSEGRTWAKACRATCPNGSRRILGSLSARARPWGAWKGTRPCGRCV
jgi:thioredoxin reductase (NADPH)